LNLKWSDSVGKSAFILLLVSFALCFSSRDAFASKRGKAKYDHTIPPVEREKYNPQSVAAQTPKKPKIYAVPDAYPYHSQETDPAQKNLVNLYIRENLHVDNVSKFNLSLFYAPAKEQFEKVFSPSDVDALNGILRGVLKESEANVWVTGPSGIGKSYLTKQLIGMFSFGIVPEFLKPVIGFENPFFKAHLNEFLGNTDIIQVNTMLLARNPNLPHEPFDSEPVRILKVMEGLLDAATREYRRVDSGGKRIGRRTIFLMDEFATYSEDFHKMMLTRLELAGFKNQDDPIAQLEETGYNVIAMSTDAGYDSSVGRLPDLQRRFFREKRMEKSKEEIILILENEAKKLADTHNGLTVESSVLEYMIRVSKRLHVPELAMPAGGKKMLQELYNSMNNKNIDPSNPVITLREAQIYIVERMKLAPVFLPGPNGELPLYDLANQVKKLQVGQDEAVENIADLISSWWNYGGEIPLLFLPGPTGTGKDTLHSSFSQVMFKNSGRHFMVSIAGVKGYEIESLFKGPPRGNHSDGLMPVIQERLHRFGPGMPFLNETAEASKFETDKLKSFSDNPAFMAEGPNAMYEELSWPMWFAGQQTEELLAGLFGNDLQERYDSLTQADIENAILHRPGSNGVGEFSQAFLTRILERGGIFMLRPHKVENFPKISKIKAAAVNQTIKTSRNYDIQETPAFHNAVTTYAVNTGRENTARVLGALTNKFIKISLLRSSRQGLPPFDSHVELDATADGSNIIVRHLSPTGEKLNEWQYAPEDLSLEKKVIIADPLSCSQALKLKRPKKGA
jgi:MoxR-like ATPase